MLLLLLLAPSLSTAHPSPPLLTSPYTISLAPHHTLFLRQQTDLQTFASALGGVRAPPITSSGDLQRPFEFQGCQGVANGAGGGGGGKGGLTVGMCDDQKAKCNTAQQQAKVKDFSQGVLSTNIGPDPLFPDFDLICEG
ncbi:hypothetical protein EJ07DRAFT_169912 [Lizonia empirigonia]|nr:hypothetical protein EJ07DRAFT_169912 [Lizonia empirigonia]